MDEIMHAIRDIASRRDVPSFQPVPEALKRIRVIPRETIIIRFSNGCIYLCRRRETRESHSVLVEPAEPTDKMIDQILTERDFPVCPACKRTGVYRAVIAVSTHEIVKPRRSGRRLVDGPIPIR